MARKPDPETGGYVVVSDTTRNGFVIIPDMTRSLKPPHIKCPSCGATHLVKTYHIYVNGEGRAVVSPGVFKALKYIGFGGLLVVEAHTDKPPTQELGTRKNRSTGQLEAGLLLQRETMVAHY